MTLEACNLTCLRGSRRLFSDIAFKLEPGQLLHLRGNNGSGKTSLLRILSGLSRPESGRVCWKENDIRELGEEYSASLAYLGHHPALKDDLTAAENLLLACQLAGLSVTPGEVDSALGKMGLAERCALPAHYLSQGQRRRLALARLWLQDRPLWILDEPFTALDVSAAALLEKRISEHLSGGGMVVLTSHQALGITPAASLVLGEST